MRHGNTSPTRQLHIYIYIYESAIFLQILFRYVLTGRWNIVTLFKNLLLLIPDMTLTMMILVPKQGWFLSGAWYLSTMSVCILVMYPLLLAKFEYSSKILLPMMGCFVLGWIYKFNGYIEGVDFWAGIASISLLRAFSEMSIGVGLFQLTRKVAMFLLEHSGTAISIFALITKLVCYLIVFGFAISNAEIKYDIYVFIIIAIGLLLSLAKPSIKSGRLTDFLGKYSLCLFLGHGIVRFTAADILGRSINNKMLIFIIALCYFFALFLMFFAHIAKKAINSMVKCVNKTVET